MLSSEAEAAEASWRAIMQPPNGNSGRCAPLKQPVYPRRLRSRGMLGATEISAPVNLCLPSLGKLAVVVLVVLLLNSSWRWGLTFPIPWNDEKAFIARFWN